MKTTCGLISVFTVALIFSSCQIQQNVSESKDQPVKIIFMIGDGMSGAHLYAAMTRHGAPIFLEQFPYSGFQKTNSLTKYITDSAAGGTALATGQKTKNSIIAQDTLGNNLESILKIAAANGLSTGVVSTCSVTAATLAVFYANQPSRSLEEKIAYDLTKADIDVFIGGGTKYFTDRKDGLNLLDTFVAKGYTVTQNMDEVRAFKSGKLAGFVAVNHAPKISEGRGEMLADATVKAIELLNKNKKGFFLIIEGSMIDWGGHANDLEYIIDETLDFDRAAGKALEFARNDGNTLVVVTADHETGGLTLTGGNIQNKIVEGHFSTWGHTASMVPIFSFGPGAENFSGILDNTEFFKFFMEIYGFPNE